MSHNAKIFYIIFAIAFCSSFASIEIEDDLKNALEDLYEFSPKIKYQRELLKGKDELVPQAFSDFRPKISGYYEKGKVDTNSSGFNITSDGIRTESNKGLIITQDIFDGGSSISNIKAAFNEIKAERYNLKTVEQEVFLEGIKLYGELATEMINLNLSEKNVEFLKRQLDLVKQQFEIGEVTLTDVSIADARYLLGYSEKLKIESNLKSLRAKYLSFFGKDRSTPSVEFSNFLPSLKNEPEQNLKYLKDYNPSLQNLNFLIKSSEKKIQSLQRKRLPSVSLEAEAKINKGYFRTDSEREVLSAFTKVEIPLYQSGLASSKIREEKQKLFALEELFLEKYKELEFELISEISNYNFSFSRIEAYKSQIKSNKIFLEGLQQELLLGERTTLDILDGEQELLKSQLDLATSKNELFVSYYKILFILGKLNAKNLKLDVVLFDERKNFNNVKFKWLDIFE
tara:strand:+ start:113 stop:1480 length:1368 start_codon:yes stop_codon:yes gene_type:complete